MINVIIDLNNIAHRSLFVVGGYGSKSYSFDSQFEVDQLMRKMAMDLALIIRSISPSRVILAKDYSSWRKEISIEENDGYKAQRKKSGIINWENVYKALDEFCEIMQEKGMILSHIKSAEADDVICMWSEKFINIPDNHTVIVSGDEDMRQLVKSNKELNTHITVYNPFTQGKNSSKKLYVSDNFIEWLSKSDAISLFNMKASLGSVDKQDFNRIITSERTKMEKLDGNDIILRKLFCGDDGDNVPAIYTWLTKDGKGNDKEVRVTNSKYEKFLEEFKKLKNLDKVSYNDLLDNANDVKNILEKILKTSIPFDMKDRILRQCKLLCLDSSFFPDVIKDDFNMMYELNMEKPKLNTFNTNMNDMLAGTRYISNDKIRNEAKIFKDVDNLKFNSLF